MLEAPRIAEITVQDSIRDRLDMLIRTIEPGYFLQIERVGEADPISIVALRYTGDHAAFAREIERMFVDAVDSLAGSQTIEVRITTG